MDSKKIGGICAIISIISIAIFMILAVLGVPNSWLAIFIGGIACAIVSIIGNMINNNKEKEEK